MTGMVAFPRVGTDNTGSSSTTSLDSNSEPVRPIPAPVPLIRSEYRVQDLQQSPSVNLVSFSLRSGTDPNIVSVPRSEQILRKVAPPSRAVPLYELGLVVQDWEGFVVELGNGFFTARLLDRTRSMKVDTEIAEIPIGEVDDGDRDLVKEGAIFYLTVRRRILPNGRQETSSGIVFRRLPQWHQSTLDRAKAQAKELANFFESDT